MIQVLKLLQCVFSFAPWQKQLFLNQATVRFVLCYWSSGQDGRRLLNLKKMANIIFFLKNLFINLTALDHTCGTGSLILVVARGSFIVACELSCSMWDLVP